MMNKISILLGGYVAEKLFLGSDKISTHCQKDLKKATDIAYMMVREFGMEEQKYGLAVSQTKQLSEGANAKVDKVVHEVIKVSVRYKVGCN
jgi:ATP-dependent Zn protease